MKKNKEKIKKEMKNVKINKKKFPLSLVAVVRNKGDEEE
jgi:hypothetical protein